MNWFDVLMVCEDDDLFLNDRGEIIKCEYIAHTPVFSVVGLTFDNPYKYEDIGTIRYDGLFEKTTYKKIQANDYMEHLIIEYAIDDVPCDTLGNELYYPELDENYKSEWIHNMIELLHPNKIYISNFGTIFYTIDNGDSLVSECVDIGVFGVEGDDVENYLSLIETFDPDFEVFKEFNRKEIEEMNYPITFFRVD